MKPTVFKHSRLLLSLGLAALLATGALAAAAQQPKAPARTTGYLSAGDVERRAVAEGIVTVKEIELDARLAEVEGRDAQQRKVELVIDRKTGEVLKHEVKPARQKR